MYSRECQTFCNLLNRQATRLYGSDTSFEVRYWGATANHFDNPVHKHSFFEVCYVVKGEGIYEEEESTYQLETGSMFCTRPGAWHQIKSAKGLQLLFVAFDAIEDQLSEEGRLLYSQFSTQNRCYITPQNGSPVTTLWDLFFNQIARETTASRITIQSMALTLLNSICSSFTDTEYQEDFSIRTKTSSSLIQQAVSYIHDNLASQIELKDMAQYLHISQRHVSRLFSHELGQSFTQYVQEKRIQTAIQLLTQSDSPIHHIAEKVGFNSVHYFTRTFSRKLGVPPAQFRKKQFSDTIHSK